MKTILLTGSDGFVGSHLKKRLQQDGYKVICYHRRMLASEMLAYDITINCAAELTDHRKMYQSNVELTHYLLTHAVYLNQSKLLKFIQIGSSSEYGATNKMRSEDLVCSPSNIYEGTKLSASALCLGYAHQYDLDICVARPFSLFGPNDKPRKLIPALYRSFLSHEPITVHGEAEHDWLWIEDFIDGLAKLLDTNRTQTKGQIFNFGTGVSSTNRQVIAALEEALGSSLNVVYQASQYHAHDVDNWVADASKARTVLGWAPKHNLRSGIKEYVMAEWFKEDRG